jgi:rare lipoprotein A
MTRAKEAALVSLCLALALVLSVFLGIAAWLFVSLCSTPASAAQSGIASVYSYGRTANGERVKASSLTAAHRTLPFGAKVKVTNRRNHRSVVVRINDRGPFIRGRIVDVTPAGAARLGFSGLAPVKLEVVR